MFQQGNAMGGGGFMSESQSPSVGGGPKKQQRSQSLLPVTGAIMHKAEYNTTDDVFRYEGVDLHQVTFVGIIKEIQEAATNISYRIDDGTSEFVSVKKWIDTDDHSNDQARSQCREDTYVRVLGHMKSFNEGQVRSVIAFLITPIRDFNEITFHMLEVIYSSMMIKRINGGGMKQIGGNMMQTPNRKANTGAGMEQYNNSGGMETGLTGTNKMVYNHILACQNETGISIQELQNKVRQFNGNQIRTALEWLSNEGHIYSTIDDDHFRSTAN